MTLTKLTKQAGVSEQAVGAKKQKLAHERNAPTIPGKQHATQLTETIFQHPIDASSNRQSASTQSDRVEHGLCGQH